ncbi:MAG: RNA polymerase-binding protein DksA [Pseudomonadota bacterium]
MVANTSSPSGRPKGKTLASAKKTGGASAKKTAAKARSTRKVTKKGTNGQGLRVFGVEPYKPKKNEEYMSDAQLEHFRTILERWRDSLMAEVDRTIDHLRNDTDSFPDSNDRASLETELGLELKTRDRERKLVRKINSAIERISDGSYGYCEKTGEEIGLARLEARPIATMCLDAQERYESKERHYGD